MEPIFFADQSELRKWFEKNHLKEKELLLGYFKKSSGRQSVTWPESVDQALCFGWIDGIRKSIDDLSYTIRFTPRNPKSIWSAINIKKVENLTSLGLMKPAGIAAFNKLDLTKSKIYSFEQNNVKLTKAYENIFKQNNKAWIFFSEQVPSYRRPAIHWVNSAKLEETRLRRLNILITDSFNKQKIAPLRWNIKNYTTK
ncbi:MAG: YdeI/OmpD-associated family protein [Ignavibacteriales bacterium]|nr:YdeI/OmpD-associated family protein [Ignavibacteriales bacterium]